jgi:hypothetical protein
MSAEQVELLKRARDLIAQAMTVHIYDEDNGDVPDPDCSYTALLKDIDAHLAPPSEEDQAFLDSYIEAARDEYQRDGEIEIDDDAVVSHSEEGAYVAAWVWVDKTQAE